MGDTTGELYGADNDARGGIYSGRTESRIEGGVNRQIWNL
jgi:hypothetical protein